MDGNGTSSAFVIFDFNGTLQDDVGLYYEYSVRRMFARFGLPIPSIEEYRSQVSAANYLAFFQARGFPATMTGDEFYLLVYEEIARDGARAPLFPEARRVLDTLAAAHPLALVSSMNAPNLDATLDRHGIRGHFRVVLGGVRDKVAAFTGVCETIGTTPDRAIAVGDMTDDAHAAHAARIRSIGCPRGHHARERIEALRDTIPGFTLVETLAEIPSLVRASHT